MSRVIVWFSCGAASAVAAKLAVAKYDEVEVIYCNTLASEDEDNYRFMQDVSAWIKQPIKIIGSTKYESVDDVFERTRYMSGIAGARCTVEMKKVPRFDYQRPDDIHIFGYTADEGDRFNTFVENNPELTLDWILRDNWIRKEDCFRVLREAGIEPPRVYALGFDHANCKGCVKSASPSYWQRTAKHYPDVFARRAQLSREIGCRLVVVDGERIFLDELDLNRQYKGGDGNIECGPFCQQESLFEPTT